MVGVPLKRVRDVDEFGLVLQEQRPQQGGGLLDVVAQEPVGASEEMQVRQPEHLCGLPGFVFAEAPGFLRRHLLEAKFARSEEHGANIIAALDMADEGASAAQRFVVGVRGYHEYVHNCILV
jgi:hypothetical protein